MATQPITDEQIKAYIMTFRFPKIVTIFTNIWFSFFRYFMPITMALMVIYGMIISLFKLPVPSVLIMTLFCILLFIALFALVSGIVKNLAIRRACKRIGISVQLWNSIVTENGIIVQ